MSEEVSLFSLISTGAKLHIVLDVEMRKNIRNEVIKRYSTFKKFSRYIGIKPYTFNSWIRLDKKRRQPTYDLFQRIMKVLELPITLENATVFRLNNSATNYTCINKKIKIDNKFMSGLGIFIAEGQKCTTKKITITNTNPQILEFMIDWLVKYFQIDKELICLYIYSPNKNFNHEEIKERYSKRYGINKNKIRVYYNKKSSLECSIITVHNAFLKNALDKIVEYTKEVNNPELLLDLLSGIIVGDGCISFSSERKYYEIEIAAGDYEIELIREILQKLDITYTEKRRKNKGKGNTYFICIHKKSNFSKFLNGSAINLDPKKKENLKLAISNYTFNRT